MAYCIKSGKSNKSSTSCLGRCYLPKHRCLDKEEVKPGPVPRHMGWWYTARDAPEHQLRCGWRPGHIACPVLRRIEEHNCLRGAEVGSCTRPPSPRISCPSSKCIAICTPSVCPKAAPCSGQPLIRIIRHGGQYSICTKPSNMDSTPAGPFPLKYVLNTDDDSKAENAKFSVEAKFNNYHFDYTSSQSSFVLDFSPPEPKCAIPYCKEGPC